MTSFQINVVYSLAFMYLCQGNTDSSDETNNIYSFVGVGRAEW